MTDPSRQNNFDLIRLVAAMSVLLFHATSHLDLDFGTVGDVGLTLYRLFPGVPVFFVVSGYLVSASYLRSSTLESYAQKRALRIFPGLWLVTGLSLAMVTALGFITSDVVTNPKFVFWLSGQLSIMPLYNPDFLRGFGVGALNGSLWTIPVELGFYAAVPIIFGIAAKLNLSERRMDMWIAVLFVISFAFNRWIIGHPENHASIVMKLMKYSTLTHLYMFLFGVLLQLHPSWVNRALADKAVPWVLGYGVLGQTTRWLGVEHNAIVYVAERAILANCVIAIAYTARSWSERLLHENDVSYGVYLIHMPIVNAMLYFGLSGSRWMLVMPVIGSLVCATLSWRFVEKPALALKGENLFGTLRARVRESG